MEIEQRQGSMEQSIITFIVVGFIAQLIGGTLGMAYGVSANVLLLNIGIPPVVASASIHAAEVFTSAIPGLSHFSFGNVDRKLLLQLIVPGILGGVLGVYAFTLDKDGNVIRPFVSFYLLVMGSVILWRARRTFQERQRPRFLFPLGLAGGFFDAIGGGGWGPIVTTTVIAQGHNPRLSIGSVNATSFFVTFAEVAAFVLTMPGLIFAHWQIVLGLFIGGVIAAPLAAYACKRLPTRLLMILVGILIIIMSIRTLYLYLV